MRAELTCQRAQLFDGQLVLEMSCGWGALSIYMASKYPASRVTAVCASLARQLFVRRRRRQRGLTNLKVDQSNLEVTTAGSMTEAQEERVKYPTGGVVTPEVTITVTNVPMLGLHGRDAQIPHKLKKLHLAAYHHGCTNAIQAETLTDFLVHEMYILTQP